MKSAVWSVLVVGTLLFAMAGMANANLIANGDFEGGSLAPWTAEAGVGLYTWANGNHVAQFTNTSNTGAHAALRQDFYLNPALAGITVDFDFRFESGANSTSDFFNTFLRLETDADGFLDLVKNINQQRDATSGWTHISMGISFAGLNITETDPNARLVFSLRDYAGDWAWAKLDNVVVAPVPEPSALLLFGAGLAGLAVYRRQAKK